LPRDGEPIFKCLQRESHLKTDFISSIKHLAALDLEFFTVCSKVSYLESAETFLNPSALEMISVIYLEKELSANRRNLRRNFEPIVIKKPG